MIDSSLRRSCLEMSNGPLLRLAGGSPLSSSDEESEDNPALVNFSVENEYKVSDGIINKIVQ